MKIVKASQLWGIDSDRVNFFVIGHAKVFDSLVKLNIMYNNVKL